MGKTLAVPGQTQAEQDSPTRIGPPPIYIGHNELAKPVETPPDPAEIAIPEREMVRQQAAELFGQGYSLARVSKILANHIRPDLKADKVKQVKYSRRVVRNWIKQTAFRDMVYKKAVVDVDMATPQILKGIVGSAKRGRVDAARLALELTGRHVKDESSAPNVTVQIANIPRPSTDETGPQPSTVRRGQ